MLSVYNEIESNGIIKYKQADDLMLLLHLFVVQLYLLYYTPNKSKDFQSRIYMHVVLHS
jgi:hypothetical protein